MDNQILFLILGVIIWIFQMIIKKRTKSNKQSNKKSVSISSSQDTKHERFFSTLNSFSNKLKRDMETPIREEPVVSVAHELQNVIEKTEQKKPTVSTRQKNKIAPNLKSSKTLKDSVIASEILKTKF